MLAQLDLWKLLNALCALSFTPQNTKSLESFQNVHVAFSFFAFEVSSSSQLKCDTLVHKGNRDFWLSLLHRLGRGYAVTLLQHVVH